MKMHMSFDIDYEGKKESEYGFQCSTAYGEGAYAPIHSSVFDEIKGDLSLTEEQAEFLREGTNRLIWGCINRFNTTGIDSEELFQECMIAATKALNAYDPSRVDVKLSTFIWACCENRIKMAVRQINGRNVWHDRYGRRPTWMIKAEQISDSSMDQFEEWDLLRARKSWLDRAIDDPETGLTDQERIVMQLTIMEIPQAKIAPILGTVQSEVSKKKTSAMQKLKAALARLRDAGDFSLDG